MPLIEIVVGLALVQLIAFGMIVGWARGKYGVEAPATTGNPVFERYFRVQMNTVEMMVVFVPAIYLFGQNISIGALVGNHALTVRLQLQGSHHAFRTKAR